MGRKHKRRATEREREGEGEKKEGERGSRNEGGRKVDSGKKRERE